MTGPTRRRTSNGSRLLPRRSGERTPPRPLARGWMHTRRRARRFGGSDRARGRDLRRRVSGWRAGPWCQKLPVSFASRCGGDRVTRAQTYEPSIKDSAAWRTVLVVVLGEQVDRARTVKDRGSWRAATGQRLAGSASRRAEGRGHEAGRAGRSGQDGCRRVRHPRTARSETCVTAATST